MKTENLNHDEIDQQRQQERKKWGANPKVRFMDNFFDGGLIPEFQKINQDAHIHTGDIRVLPAELLERCLRSGAVVERVTE